ncbi:MAG: hypothetical protein JWN70_2333 [Planctomycetaceae bacterium]|nr:hypothetical protein [Planctomycetaceae bacterium]
MRALCGAIITAGALIGLGLTALAYGIRFQSLGNQLNPTSNQLYGAPSLILILVVLVVGLVTGIGIAFLGLMYHHERRYMEQRGAFGSPSEPAAPSM